MYKKLISKIVSVSVLFSGLLFGAGVGLANNASTEGYLSLTAEYHAEANSVVNQHFQKLYTFFDTVDLDDPDYLNNLLAVITPPSDPSLSTAEMFAICQENLSSYCLQINLNNLYLVFENRIAPYRSTLATNPSSDLTTALVADATPASFINEQLSLIQILNNQSVEFYRQALFAFPVHIQNQKIIDNLEVLVDNLRDLEAAISPYPSIFHNVTTTECI